MCKLVHTKAQNGMNEIQCTVYISIQQVQQLLSDQHVGPISTAQVSLLHGVCQLKPWSQFLISGTNIISAHSN